MDEYMTTLNKNFKKNIVITLDEEDETVAVTVEDIIETTKDFIPKELSMHLKGYDLEKFVAKQIGIMENIGITNVRRGLMKM